MYKCSKCSAEQATVGKCVKCQNEITESDKVTKTQDTKSADQDSQKSEAPTSQM